MAASDTLTSLDRTLAQVRQEYDNELAALRNDLVQAKAEASALRDMLEREGAKATTAIQMAAGLIAHFGAVGKIFDDAKTIAEKAKVYFSGFETKTEQLTKVAVSDVEAVSQKAIDQVEAALHNHLETPNVPLQTNN